MAFLIPLLLAGALAAAPTPTKPGRMVMPPAPPVVVVPPPMPRQERCEGGAPERVPVPDSDLVLCIGSAAGAPVLATASPGGSVILPPIEIDLPMAIAILADERMAALWPRVEMLLGDGGDGLRSAMVARAGVAVGRDRASTLSWSRGTLESLNSASTRAVLDLARVLDMAGRPDDALAVLDARLPALSEDAEVGDDQEYDRLSNRLRYANILYSNARYDEAVAVLERVERDPTIGRDYRVNAAVNRAAYLAEMGRGADALAAVAQAREQFDDTDASYSIDGSGRQFAWIRACALHQLGRAGEAAALMRELDAAPERLPSRTGAVVPLTSSIELRAALCLEDVDRLAALLRDRRDAMPMPMGHMLQDGWRFVHPRNAALFRAARARAERGGERLPVRQVPARYLPALARAPLAGASSRP